METAGQALILGASGLARAQVEKHRKDGKDLTGDEVKSIAIQSTVMFVAMAIVGRLGRPILTAIEGEGQILGNAIRMANLQRRAALTLASGLHASSAPEQASKALFAERLALEYELEAYRLFGKEAGAKPELLEKAGLTRDQLDELQGAVKQQAGAILRMEVVLALKELGAHHYLSPPEQIGGVLTTLQRAGGQVGAPKMDPVTGAMTYAVEFKDGLRIRVTVEKAPVAIDPWAAQLGKLPQMAEILSLVRQHADAGFHAVLQNLVMQRRVYPLTREGIHAALSNKAHAAQMHTLKTGEPLPDHASDASVDARTERLTNEWIGKAYGVYHPDTGVLFIADGATEFLAHVVVHETTHYFQHKYFPSAMNDFKPEIQAHGVEQRMLKSMAADPATSGRLSNDQREFMDQPARSLGLAIESRYDNAPMPEDFNPKEFEEMVMEVVRAVQVFR